MISGSLAIGAVLLCLGPSKDAASQSGRKMTAKGGGHTRLMRHQPARALALILVKFRRHNLWSVLDTARYVPVAPAHTGVGAGRKTCRPMSSRSLRGRQAHKQDHCVQPVSCRTHTSISPGGTSRSPSKRLPRCGQTRRGRLHLRLIFLDTFDAANGAFGMLKITFVAQSKRRRKYPAIIPHSPTCLLTQETMHKPLQTTPRLRGWIL